MPNTPPVAPEDDDDPDGAGGYDPGLDDPEDDTTGFEDGDDEQPSEAEETGEDQPETAGRHRKQSDGE
jgi:hypothetical protein